MSRVCGTSYNKYDIQFVSPDWKKYELKLIKRAPGRKYRF